MLAVEVVRGALIPQGGLMWLAGELDTGCKRKERLEEVSQVPALNKRKTGGVLS